MKYKEKIIFILLMLLLFLFFRVIVYASSVSSALENNILRLHILANSDTLEDQSLKLKVRDNIIKYLKENCDNCKSKDELYNYIVSNTGKLQEIAQKTVYDNDYNYTVTIDLGNFYFPTKHYGNISFPAGYYDGLKINIGNALRSKLVV